jgi:hypothetical protein
LAITTTAKLPTWGVQLIVMVKKLGCKKERTLQQASNVNNTAELVKKTNL